jgi:hypothetical protein
MPSKKSVRLGQQGKAAGFPILAGGFAVLRSALSSGL